MQVTQLPFGYSDLDSQVIVHHADFDQIRCYVRGCGHFVRRPTRRCPGTACPEHGIYCHHSSYGSTYSYADVRRNVIASPELFAEQIVGHPFKYESHRLGSEKSEDTLSWNVFRSLHEAGKLSSVAKMLIGEDHLRQPDLYLWGIRVSDDSFEPWDLLIAARTQFEHSLPVKRPLTEPDIALHLPGEYLVLIEAKFTSPNPYYQRGPRKDAQSLTLDELLSIYHDPASQILNHEAARRRDCIPYQLWRNMLFAERMAAADDSSTRAYHVNLVRRSAESHTAKEFARLITPERQNRFHRVDWESIAEAFAAEPSSHESQLLEYLSGKTAGLAKAFEFDHV